MSKAANLASYASTLTSTGNITVANVTGNLSAGNVIASAFSGNGRL